MTSGRRGKRWRRTLLMTRRAVVLQLHACEPLFIWYLRQPRAVAAVTSRHVRGAREVRERRSLLWPCSVGSRAFPPPPSPVDRACPTLTVTRKIIQVL